MSRDRKKPVKKEPSEKKTLTGAEKIRKQSEDYELKPPKNLRPPSPEEAVTQQSDHQEKQ